MAGVRDVLPVGLIVFTVVGFIFLGLATPTESAAMGVLACFFVAAIRKRFNWILLKDSVMNTTRISVMLLLIIAGGMFFSQVLSYSGAARGLGEFVGALAAPPMLIIAAMIVGIIFLGLFMDAASIMMITLPIFLPLVKLFGFDPVWFVVLFLIGVEIGLLTPPFGLLIFVMKGVSRSGTTIEDIVMASLPFLLLSLITMGIIMAFPEIALFLPGQMR
jgi:tripartite ATP-independent transporter DctM subunit